MFLLKLTILKFSWAFDHIFSIIIAKEFLFSNASGSESTNCLKNELILCNLVTYFFIFYLYENTYVEPTQLNEINYLPYVEFFKTVEMLITILHLRLIDWCKEKI